MDKLILIGYDNPMNKGRIEAFSDGVFSIVMTLLVLDIRLPHHTEGNMTNGELLELLTALGPVLRSYVISFTVLGMYWVAQHAYFHLFVKQVDRVTAWLNLLFLMLIVFIPFTTNLIGQYPYNEVAIASYGVNIIGCGLTLYVMLLFMIHNRHMMHDDVSPTLIRHATIRVLIVPGFAVLGIMAGFLHSPLSFFLFGFPIVFNIIPGTLDSLDRLYLKITKKT